jgi:hypothetical protein
VGLAFLLHNLLVGFGGPGGKPLGQKKIPGIPVGDLNDIAPVSQLVDVFSQDNFHNSPGAIRSLTVAALQRFRYSGDEKGSKAMLRACLIASLKRL